MDEPRIVDGRAFLIAGLGERYNSATSRGISAQWQRFGPHIGRVPGQTAPATYGVICNHDGAGNSDYITGVEVKDFSRIPEGWERLTIGPQKYAVFPHRGDLSTIRETWFAIWERWLPESGYQAADAPAFERYGESFEPQAGTGAEIWIPVR